MSKLYLFMMVSVDGYFEGENHDLSWHHVDAEFNDFAIAQLHNTQALLFGRRTYDLMAGYWPSAQARGDDPTVAGLMNTIPKYAFSRSKSVADKIPHWENVTWKHDIVAREIADLKTTSAKDVGIFGSNNLCVQMMELGLIDEFRLMISPIALGRGNTLFTGLPSRHELRLISTKQFRNGNILLTYVPAKS